MGAQVEVGRASARRAFGAAALATLVAVVVGVVLGVAVGWLAARIGPETGWQDLAGVVLGMLAAVLVGLVVWLVLVVRAARRTVPRGRRVGAVLLLLAVWVLGTLGVWWAVRGPGGGLETPAFAIVAGASLVSALLGCAVFGWWAARR